VRYGVKMEGLVMHGAAHIFFENKLAEVEDMFNKKFKKVELKFREEILQMDKLHCHEMKKIKGELRLLREEVSDIRKSEENLSQKGMDKICKLSKEVKTELNEIKKLKNDVGGLKKEVVVIRQSEEDISHYGMDKITKINDDFKSEVKQLKSDLKLVKKDLELAKETKPTIVNIEVGRRCEDEVAPLEPDKDKIKKHSMTIPSTIPESGHSTEEENDYKPVPTTIPLAEIQHSREEVDQGVVVLPQPGQQGKEDIGPNAEDAAYQDNYMRNFNDDYLRRLVFSSQESSDYHHESSDYHESDAVSDDEEFRSAHGDHNYRRPSRTIVKKFLFK